MNYDAMFHLGLVLLMAGVAGLLRPKPKPKPPAQKGARDYDVRFRDRP